MFEIHKKIYNGDSLRNYLHTNEYHWSMFQRIDKMENSHKLWQEIYDLIDQYYFDQNIYHDMFTDIFIENDDILDLIEQYESE